jgi:hypothetical protein
VTRCCLTTSPITVTCIPEWSVCEGSGRSCDGPEDCLSGFACCVVRGSSTACQSGCDSQSGNTPICHDDRDCPSQTPVCNATSPAPGLSMCAAAGGKLR